MYFHSQRSVPYYTFPTFEAFPSLVHGVLTRRGGVSPAPWDSLNLGWTVGDAAENVETNYRCWTHSFGLERDSLTTTWQVHSADILLAGNGRRGGSLGRADGLVTRTPGIPLVQRYADCTPILAYDPVQHACGIAHAGWQGTVRRCAEALIRTMQGEMGSDPADIIAAVGPAIGPCCYEIGAEVITAVQDSQSDPASLLTPTRPEHARFDLWEANARQLRECGVEQIEIAGMCTACQRDIFFSHRGDKGRSGRFAAFVMLLDTGD